MKLSKKIVSLGATLALISSLGAAAAFATNEADENLITASVNDVAQATLYDELMAAEDVETMYALVLDAMNGDPDSLNALTSEEIASLRERVAELDPEGDDADTADLLDTLAVLAGEELEGDPDALATATITGNPTWVANSRITEDTVWTFENGAVITMTEGPITIQSGYTLELKGYGGFKRGDGCTEWMFIVEEGAKLLINGNSEGQPITIDGNNVIASTGMISTAGELSITNGVIKNGKNRAENGAGGGIVVTSNGCLALKNSVVTGNTASAFGGGILCYGEMEIVDSTISYNRAMSTEPGGDQKANKGRGGGFHLGGDGATGTLNNVLITENAAMYYGGGGQVSNGATLTMSGNTVFSNNKAVLHGAGALHVTDDATFTMNGGKMENNTAQSVGGAIHSSYTCVLNLNAGQILNNTANGRAGGINVNTGGTITLGSGLTISGNKAYAQRSGSSATVDSTGDNWSNVKYEGENNNNGYGGGLCLDSAECVVKGATIENNYAVNGGGAIALIMVNGSVFEHIKDMKCVNFTMTSGKVSGNTTDGDGAGVYMMSNKIDKMLHYYYDDYDGTNGYNDAVNELSSKDLLTAVPLASISGGSVEGNIATGNGGGLYLDESTKFVISGTGVVSDNKAVNGAGVYVASGTAEISGGTMKSNVASNYGGALYISGDVAMTGGTIGGDAEADANSAVNGGAMYVTNGNVTIEHGSINGNKAVGSGDLQDAANDTGRGGAVYLAGDANTIFTMESGSMNMNAASNDGGAVFATGGTILIGLESCSPEAADAACAHHIDKGEGRHHPIISENKASDTGGGIALADGVVRFYCGKAKDNQALYKGVGKNVFMDGGKFYLYDGADVGVPRDPDLVIVGGELYNECMQKEYYNLYYYYQNTDATNKMTGLAEYQEIMNLPDGEYFWEAPEGYVFLGWTAQGAASGNQSNEFVRNKEQYVNSGEPIEILDAVSAEIDQTAANTNRLLDGTSDKTLHLYALWAPEESDITYVDGLTGATIPNTDADPDNPATYVFSRVSNVIQVQPVTKAGYDLVGWYVYQDADQNANWNDTQTDYESKKYEPNYTGADYSTQKVYLELDSRNGVLELEVGNTNFGNITLVAKFEPAYGNLTITKTFSDGEDHAVDEGRSFVFRIVGDPSNESLDDVDMEVVVSGAGSVTVADLPIGEYTVTEEADWSWRYELADNGIAGGDGQGWSVDIANRTASVVLTADGASVTFTNETKTDKWLSFDGWCLNLFKMTNDGINGIYDGVGVGTVSGTASKKN